MNSYKKRNPILAIQGIRKSFGNDVVLDDVNFEVSPGERILLMGGNGTGKSTLLKIIAGIIRANTGKIIFDGKDITENSTDSIVKLGMSSLLQGGIIFPKLFVFEHFQLISRENRAISAKKKMEKIFDIFPDMEGTLNKRAGVLSGGERQKLAMALLILQDAKLWLLDEPLSGIARHEFSYVLDSLKTISDNNNISIVLVEQIIDPVIRMIDKGYELIGGTIIPKSI